MLTAIQIGYSNVCDVSSYHVPEVRLVKTVALKTGVESSVQISLCNPTPHDITLALLPFVPEAYLQAQEKGETKL